MEEAKVKRLEHVGIDVILWVRKHPGEISVFYSEKDEKLTLLHVLDQKSMQWNLGIPR